MSEYGANRLGIVAGRVDRWPECSTQRLHWCALRGSSCSCVSQRSGGAYLPPALWFRRAFSGRTDASSVCCRTREGIIERIVACGETRPYINIARLCSADVRRYESG